MAGLSEFWQKNVNLWNNSGRTKITMKLLKRILVVAVIILVIIQFIQPAKNQSAQSSPNDISKVIAVPDSVQVILKNACFDCHSNNTEYPWYFHIQPVAWYLANHITKAKKELNFNEFAGYPARKQQNKLEAIANEITDNGMPLPSYRLMHKNARLDKVEKALLTNWAQHMEDSLAKKQ